VEIAACANYSARAAVFRPKQQQRKFVIKEIEKVYADTVRKGFRNIGNCKFNPRGEFCEDPKSLEQTGKYSDHTETLWSL
jgi:hypothetical protein